MRERLPNGVGARRAVALVATLALVAELNGCPSHGGGGGGGGSHHKQAPAGSPAEQFTGRRTRCPEDLRGICDGNNYLLTRHVHVCIDADNKIQVLDGPEQGAHKFGQGKGDIMDIGPPDNQFIHCTTESSGRYGCACRCSAA